MMDIKTEPTKNVPPEVVGMVTDMVKKCAKELGKKQYQLPKLVCPIRLRIRNNPYQCSRGGEGYLSINVGQYMGGNRSIHEYSRIKHDPTIGSIELPDPTSRLMAVVAHEFAHYVQHSYRYPLKNHRYPKHNWDKPHGNGWQMVYAWLRRKFVNPYRV